MLLFGVRSHKSTIFKMSHYHQDTDLQGMEEGFHETLQYFDFLCLIFVCVVILRHLGLQSSILEALKGVAT